MLVDVGHGLCFCVEVRADAGHGTDYVYICETECRLSPALTHPMFGRKPRDNYTVVQCRIKLLGALCQTQMGAPVICHSLFPIPVVSLTASRLKWGLVPIDIMMTSALILTI